MPVCAGCPEKFTSNLTTIDDFVGQCASVATRNAEQTVGMCSSLHQHPHFLRLAPFRIPRDVRTPPAGCETHTWQPMGLDSVMIGMNQISEPEVLALRV
jgi:hypothetical protein